MIGNFFNIITQLFGMWRSLVAHTHGVRGVAGSNPVIPTFNFYFHSYKELNFIVNGHNFLYIVCLKSSI